MAVSVSDCFGPGRNTAIDSRTFQPVPDMVYPDQYYYCSSVIIFNNNWMPGSPDIPCKIYISASRLTAELSYRTD